MKEHATILFTSAGGSLIPSEIVELRKSRLIDYRIIGVDAAPTIAHQQFFDAFYQVPYGNQPGYIERLCEIVIKETVDLVIPRSDEESLGIAAAAPQIKKAGAEALVSSISCLTLIADKAETYKKLAKAGLTVPIFSVVHTVDDLGKALTDYGFPEKTVVIKPARGRGGRGLAVLCGQDDPAKWLGKGNREKRLKQSNIDPEILNGFISGKTVVMPCLWAPAFDADVLSLGRELVVIPRKRGNPAGIPFRGNTVVADPELIDYCVKAAQILGLDGLHDIDLMTDPVTKKPVVLEVNPRPSGSLAATLAAGFPLIDWAVAHMMGRKADVHYPQKDIEIIERSFLFAVKQEG